MMAMVMVMRALTIMGKSAGDERDMNGDAGAEDDKCHCCAHA